MSYSLTPHVQKYKGDLYREFKSAVELAKIVRNYIKENKDGIFDGCRFSVKAGDTKWGRLHSLSVTIYNAPFNPYQGEIEDLKLPVLSPEMERVRSSIEAVVTPYWRADNHSMSDYHDQNFYADLMVYFHPTENKWYDELETKN